MENSMPAPAPYHSRWYKGKLLEVYTRVGCNYEGLENETVICLANVGVTAKYRGKGFFSALLEFLEGHKDQLRATFLIVESVGNSRLASKLEILGFSRFVLIHRDSSPTFYRRLGNANSPESATA